MTPEQYTALTRLMRARPGSVGHEAARRVLVDGESQRDVAVSPGMSSSIVSDALARCRRAMELVRIAAGADEEEKADNMYP